jgi:hypothetical protein
LKINIRPKHVAYILKKTITFVVVDGSTYTKIDTIYHNGMSYIKKIGLSGYQQGL